MARSWTRQFPVFFIVCFAILSISGCAGSNKTVIPLDLSGDQEDTINFMPFNSEFTRAYYSDVDKKVAGGLLMQAIMEEVNQKSGLYTYTFDETDLQNLRASIKDSLTESNHYKEVKDVDLTDNMPSDKGPRLYIEFESMGVSQSIAFVCEIKAHAKVCDGSEAILAEKDISVREKGIVTLMAAKNKAIKEFIMEIGQLLNEA
jgi:hypothetical protein